MIALLAALLLTAPMPPARLERCVIQCKDSFEGDVPVSRCWYDLAPSCGRARACVETQEVVCVPRAIVLWDFTL